MCDVRIVKAADDMTDGIGQTDVGQKLVAQSFAFAGTFHQSGDIGKLKGRIDRLFRMKQLCQTIHACIRHFDDADIGLNGRKRIVGRFDLTFGNCVEQRGLSDVGKSYDSCC